MTSTLLLPPPIPVQLSDFDVEKKLGGGAFGIAYLVRVKTPSQQQVMEQANPVLVLKHFHRVPGHDTKRTLADEAVVLDALRPGCENPDSGRVCFRGWFEDNGEYFLLLNYGGPALDSVLKDMKKDGERTDDVASGGERQQLLRRKDLACGVARGIRTLHELGFAHRDIKPANLTALSDDAGSVAPKVSAIDFGLACRNDDCRDRRPRGTLLYMSPEAYSNKNVFQYDASLWQEADLWATALTDFEILTGRNLFVEFATMWLREHPEQLIQAEAAKAKTNKRGDQSLPSWFEPALQAFWVHAPEILETTWPTSVAAEQGMLPLQQSIKAILSAARDPPARRAPFAALLAACA